MTPQAYSADALLRDGSSIHLRAIRPDDKDRLLAHFRKLGPDSVWLRFMGVKKELTAAELRYFTELDFATHVGIVAARRGDRDEEFIGVGRYVCCGDSRPGRSA